MSPSRAEAASGLRPAAPGIRRASPTLPPSSPSSEARISRPSGHEEWGVRGFGLGEPSGTLVTLSSHGGRSGLSGPFPGAAPRSTSRSRARSRRASGRTRRAPPGSSSRGNGSDQVRRRRAEQRPPVLAGHGQVDQVPVVARARVGVRQHPQVAVVEDDLELGGRHRDVAHLDVHRQASRPLPPRPRRSRPGGRRPCPRSRSARPPRAARRGRSRSRFVSRSR